MHDACLLQMQYQLCHSICDDVNWKEHRYGQRPRNLFVRRKQETLCQEQHIHTYIWKDLMSFLPHPINNMMFYIQTHTHARTHTHTHIHIYIYNTHSLLHYFIYNIAAVYYLDLVTGKKVHWGFFMAIVLHWDAFTLWKTKMLWNYILKFK